MFSPWSYIGYPMCSKDAGAVPATSTITSGRDAQ